MKPASRRQRLLIYVESGRLRDALSRRGDRDEEVTDLIIDLCGRYCSSRRRRRRPTPEAKLLAAVEPHLEKLSNEEIAAKIAATERILADRAAKRPWA